MDGDLDSSDDNIDVEIEFATESHAYIHVEVNADFMLVKQVGILEIQMDQLYFNHHIKMEMPINGMEADLMRI